MSQYRIDHTIIDGLHVLTSPDVRGLYIAHADKNAAFAAVEESIKVLDAINARQKERVRAEQKLAVA